MLNFLTKKDLPKPYCDLCNRTLQMMVKNGTFPPFVLIGQTKAWSEEMVFDHMTSLQPIDPKKPYGNNRRFTSEGARAAINKRWEAHRARQAKARERQRAAATAGE